jgi:hypothetical protein
MLKAAARRMLWRILGPPPFRTSRRSWDIPVDTLKARHSALDWAILNMHICTRRERDRLPAAQEHRHADSESLLGDYAEFGVFSGETFAHACRRAAPLMPWMRFFAFDSFQGLPEPTGDDADGEFWGGQFQCSATDFSANLRAKGVDESRVVVVPGWFKETLSPRTAEQHGLRIASIAFIDCDLYESCVPVLSFLTALVRQGTILLFDDWYTFKGAPTRGVQRATSEWLALNPRLSLTSWFPFCHHGQAFVVTARQ